MKCPDCGSEMNYHADKLDYSAAVAPDGAADVELGGVIQQVHTCPDCGRTEMRVAP